MKHKGNRGEACIYRQRKIYELYTKIKRTGECATIDEICKRIASMKMDRYYMSEERARDIYLRFRRKGEIDPCSKYAYGLRLGLVHECERIRKERGTDCIIYIVREALEQPARCIGLSPNRIQRILREGGML